MRGNEGADAGATLQAHFSPPPGGGWLLWRVAAFARGVFGGLVHEPMAEKSRMVVVAGVAVWVQRYSSTQIVGR